MSEPRLMNVLNINLTLYLQIVAGCRIPSFISTLISLLRPAFLWKQKLPSPGLRKRSGIKCLLRPYFIGTWGGGKEGEGGDKLSHDKLCLALDTRGAYLDPQVPPPPPRMWEWSSPICSDEMPNFWKVNILQTNTINIWPLAHCWPGRWEADKRGEAREIITPRWKQSWGEKQTLTRGDNDDNFLWGQSQDSELWRGCKHHPSWHGGRWDQWYYSSWIRG